MQVLWDNLETVIVAAGVGAFVVNRLFGSRHGDGTGSASPWFGGDDADCGD